MSTTMHPRKHIGPLPKAFRDRRWRLWSPDGTSAVRLDGPPSAPFSAAVHLNPGGWGGYLEPALRTLQNPAETMLEAIGRLEAAEREGMYSPLWRNPGIAPERTGWAHRVRGGRDEWHAVTDAPYLVLSVFLLRSVTSIGVPGEVFIVLIDGMPLTQLGGDPGAAVNCDAITLFRDARRAMKAAEAEATLRFAAAGINHPMRLLNRRSKHATQVMEGA